MTSRAAVVPSAWYALATVAAAQMVGLHDRNILAIVAPSIKAALGIGDPEISLF